MRLERKPCDVPLTKTWPGGETVSTNEAGRSADIGAGLAALASGFGVEALRTDASWLRWAASWTGGFDLSTCAVGGRSSAISGGLGRGMSFVAIGCAGWAEIARASGRGRAQ